VVKHAIDCADDGRASHTSSTQDYAARAARACGVARTRALRTVFIVLGDEPRDHERGVTSAVGLTSAVGRCLRLRRLRRLRRRDGGHAEHNVAQEPAQQLSWAARAHRRRLRLVL
jgi:hypothetical protein